METLLRTADDILRRAPWTLRIESPLGGVARLLACVLAFGALYGFVMGLYRGVHGHPGWLLQAAYSAIKTPLLVTGSLAVGLPTFFVTSTIIGLRQDFARAVRALIAGQATLAITLASLSPVTLLAYVSGVSYQQALVFNGLVFAIASLAGQLVVREHFRPLIAANPRHARLLAWWALVYAFVAIQLAWLLRPFIGSSQLAVSFFRPEAWDNAYVILARLLWSTLAGM